MKKKEKFFGLLGISTIGILLPISICINGYANSALAATQTKTTTANASVRVSNFCSMTANIQPGEEHSTTLIGGQYQSDIGKTTIQTFCNDPNGYAIYAIGYTGGDTGVANGTNTVLHSNALGSTYDIVTGIATSGDISNWAMKVSSVSGTYAPTIESDTEGSFSNYHTVPQSYTKVASYSTNTDLDNPASTRQGSKLTTTYAAYISPTQDAGTYEGAVKYVLVNPSTMDSPYYMQNVDEWGDTIAVGREVIAYDTRDNKSYTVRRMCMEGAGSTWQEREANCTSSMLWMTQNLDLDLARGALLTSEDTDLNVVDSSAYNTDYTAGPDGIIYWNPATTTITSVNTATGKFNGWLDTYIIAYSADPNEGGFIEGQNQKVGNYYNWSAAIASSNSSSIQSKNYDSKNSICPRGWRLPIASNEINDFTKLNNIYNNGASYNGDGLIADPVYMFRSGFVVGGAIGYFNDRGYYWSCTAYNLDFAISLYISDYRANPTNGGNRNNGWSIRCVSDY